MIVLDGRSLTLAELAAIADDGEPVGLATISERRTEEAAGLSVK